MIPLAELKYLLRESASAETSVTPELWTPENWSYGHCAVFTLMAHYFYGGKILRGLLPKEWAERLGYRSHYWNLTWDGKIIDLSRDQFPKRFPYEDFIEGKIGEFPDREDKRLYLFSSGDTARRSRILRERFVEKLHSNPLFLDEKFQRCWELAFSEDAKCPKMRFACLVYDRDRLIAQDVNRLMTTQFGRGRFCSLDGSRCVRLEMSSRMDPVIGDCGHAPIWCLWRVLDLGYFPKDLPLLDFYEAGFYPDGSPWWRKEPTYTCIYCQNVFATLGLDKIWIPLDGQWIKVYTSDSFYDSAPYVRGEKEA